MVAAWLLWHWPSVLFLQGLLPPGEWPPEAPFRAGEAHLRGVLGSLVQNDSSLLVAFSIRAATLSENFCPGDST